MLNKRDLEEFVGLVTQSEKKKLPEVRINTANARRIADGLTYLLMDLEETKKVLGETQKNLSESQVVTVELDGGKF